MDSAEARKRLLNARRDPVGFFGADVDNVFREYARVFHPDHGGDKDLFQLLVSLRDEALITPEVIVSSAREYSVRSTIGRGDLCDVLYAVADGKPFVLKRPYIDAPAANNLMAKERECLEQLQEQSAGSSYRHYIPQPVESFTVGKKRINVFEWRDGLFTAQEIVAKHGALHDRHLAWMFKRMLTACGYAHSKGWVHGAMVPQHAMFSVADHGLCVGGWIHAESSGKPIKIVPSVNKHWYPKTKTATPSVDIWMAAKTLVFLSGGNPESGEMPDSVPVLMRQFIQSCFLSSAAMLPVDAWELQDQFTDLLDQLYGPPRFVSLEM